MDKKFILTIEYFSGILSTVLLAKIVLIVNNTTSARKIFIFEIFHINSICIVSLQSFNKNISKIYKITLE